MVQKVMFCLALVLVFMLPVFSGTKSFAGTVNDSMTIISLYNSGTNNSTIIPSYGVKPITRIINADVCINNPLAQNIWGWNLGVTWNPAVLQLKTVTEGPYLMDTGTTVFITAPANNKNGTIPGGISDIYLGNMTTNASAGVLATLTFNLTDSGNSTINLTAGLPTLVDNHQQPIACQLTGATFIQLTGDINGDSRVNVLDLIVIANAIGTKPGQPKWNPYADLKHAGVINVLDLIICANHLGQRWS